jgi:hypothetical protein
LAGGGEVVGRLPGTGVIVPDDALRSGEGVFAELPGCFKVTQCQQSSGEFVCGIDGVMAVVTEDSPSSDKSTFAELSRYLMFAQGV